MASIPDAGPSGTREDQAWARAFLRPPGDDVGPARASEEAEALAASLLRRGQVEQFRRSLVGAPGLTVLGRLLVADAGVRVQAIPIDAVQALAPEVRAAERADWRWWLAAIDAEYHLWRGDPTAVIIARSTIDLLPPAQGTWADLGRSRLLRILALGSLFAGGDAVDTAPALVAEAVTLAERAEQPAEAAATPALTAAFHALLHPADARRDRVALANAVEQIVALGSDRADPARLLEAWAAAAEHDWAGMGRRVDQIDRAALVTEQP